MTRICEEKFVADNLVKFNTEAIDSELEKFCPDDYLPLKAVQHFHSFPLAEYKGRTISWNLYLLESFVRKRSCVFRYLCPATNNQNSGVILRKSSRYTDYKQITTDAITKAGIARTDKQGIYDFLTTGGYICNRSGNWLI